MNNTERLANLASEKVRLEAVYQTLYNLQMTLGYTSPEWKALQTARRLVVKQVTTLSEKQEELNRREYEAATRTSWGLGRAG
jgi:uncharacterized protein (DUF3084 family)